MIKWSIGLRRAGGAQRKLGSRLITPIRELVLGLNQASFRVRPPELPSPPPLCHSLWHPSAPSLSARSLLTTSRHRTMLTTPKVMEFTFNRPQG